MPIRFIGAYILAALLLSYTVDSFGNSSRFCPSVHAIDKLTTIASWRQGAQLRYRMPALLEKSPYLLEVQQEVSSLSPMEKEALSAELTRMYGMVQSEKKRPEVEQLKRTLDIIVTNIIDPYSAIQQSLQQGQTPLQAWTAVLQKTQKLIGLKNGFSAEEILNSLIRLQKNLAALNDQFDPIRKTSFIVFGSWPNGRAVRNVSDMDLFSENMVQRQFFNRQNNYNMAQRFGLSEISPSSIGTSTFDLTAASKNPIMIRVGPQTIELLVYPVLTSEARTLPPVEPLVLVLHQIP
jgi:hypothetical protein